MKGNNFSDLSDILSALAVNTRLNLWKVEELKDAVSKISYLGDEQTKLAANIIKLLTDANQVLFGFEESLKEAEELVHSLEIGLLVRRKEEGG